MNIFTALGFCDRASWANCEVREKTNKMQQLDVYYQHFLNMFRASLCPSSGERDMCYCIWCAALVLLDVVGSSCVALRCRVRALWRLLFDSAVLWGVSSVKVVVVGRCLVGCEHCEGYCSTVLCYGVWALWRLLFDSAVLWGVSTVKVTFRQ